MDIDEQGFALVPGVLTESQCDFLIEEIGACARAGLRQPHLAISAIRDLVSSDLLRALLPENAFLVRSILFDKSAGRNWAVPWHQDLAICVRERKETPGFGSWSIKEGINHVHAPAHVLERMVTARLHLDHCGSENGPLRVIPKSHRMGRLSDSEIEKCRSQSKEVACLLQRGGALFMKPLLLHASPRAVSPTHRRVLHLEFAIERLPGGLEWIVDFAQVPRI